MTLAPRKDFCLFFCVSLLLSCKSNHALVEPITNFNITKYTGYWHEIARIDNRFKKGLTNVTALYKLTGDFLKVINKGINKTDNEYHEVHGKAIYLKKLLGIIYNIFSRLVEFLRILKCSKALMKFIISCLVLHTRNFLLKHSVVVN